MDRFFAGPARLLATLSLLPLILEVVEAGTWVGFHDAQIPAGRVTHSVATLYLAHTEVPGSMVYKLVLGFDPTEVRLKVQRHQLDEYEADAEMPSPWAPKDEEEDGSSGDKILPIATFSSTFHERLYFVVMWSWPTTPISVDTDVDVKKEEEGENVTAIANNMIATVFHAYVEKGKEERKVWRCEWGFLEVNRCPPHFLVVPDGDIDEPANEPQRLGRFKEQPLHLRNFTVGIEPGYVLATLRSYLQTLWRQWQPSNSSGTWMEFQRIRVGAAAATSPIKLYLEVEVVDESVQESIVAEKLSINYVPNEVKLAITPSTLTRQEADAEIPPALVAGNKKTACSSEAIKNGKDKSSRELSELTLAMPISRYQELYLVVLWLYPAGMVGGDSGNEEKPQKQQSIATVLHAWYQADKGRWKREWGFLEATAEEVPDSIHGSLPLLPPHFIVPGKGRNPVAVDRLVELGRLPPAIRNAYAEWHLQDMLEAVARQGSTSVVIIKITRRDSTSETYYHRVSVVLHPKRGNGSENEEELHRYSFRYSASQAKMRVAAPKNCVDEDHVREEEAGPLLLPGFNEFVLEGQAISPKMYPEVSRRAYLVVMWPRSVVGHKWEHEKWECLRDVTVSLVSFDDFLSDWRHPHSKSSDTTALWGSLCRDKRQKQHTFFFSTPNEGAIASNGARYPMEWDDINDAEAEKVERALNKLFG